MGYNTEAFGYHSTTFGWAVQVEHYSCRLHSLAEKRCGWWLCCELVVTVSMCALRHSHQRVSRYSGSW